VDDLLNGSEEGIDCGGPSCPRCGPRLDAKLRVVPLGDDGLTEARASKLKDVLLFHSGLKSGDVFFLNQDPSGSQRRLLQGRLFPPLPTKTPSFLPAL
jgi:hypothetical protein